MPERSTWTIRKKRPEPFDTEFGSIIGPAADFPVRVVEESRLRGVEAELEDARNRLIEVWHSEGPPLIAKDTTLHGFLGMTWEQYKAWVEAPGFASSPSSPAPEGGPDEDV